MSYQTNHFVRRARHSRLAPKKTEMRRSRMGLMWCVTDSQLSAYLSGKLDAVLPHITTPTLLNVVNFITECNGDPEEIAQAFASFSQESLA